MNRIIIIAALSLIATFRCFHASAQADELAQLALDIEKLSQFKQILSDMKAGYQVLEGGYNTVKDISKGNFSLHKVFLDGLLEVNPAVRNYYRVADIINGQLTLVKEYKNAYGRFKQDNNFSVDEIAYLGSVYDHLFKESLRNLDELLTVITAGKARMSDDERLQAIDRIYADVEDKLMFLRHFNNNTTILAMQRAKEKNDAKAVQQLYGLGH